MAWIAGTMVVLILVFIGVGLYRYYGRRAAWFDYSSRGAYMRAVPQTDEEKREAVDQAFLGVVICLLALLLPPLLLVGVLLVYVGGRKTVCVLMALGYVDEAGPPDA